MPRVQSLSLADFILTMLELDVHELRAIAGPGPKAREAVGTWKVKPLPEEALEGDRREAAEALAAEILDEVGDARSVRVDAYAARGKYLRRWERTEEDDGAPPAPPPPGAAGTAAAPGQGEGTLAERVLWRMIDSLERRERNVGMILDSAARMLNAQAAAYEASTARENAAREEARAAEEEAREVAGLANEIVSQLREGGGGDDGRPSKGSPMEKQAAEAVKELLKGFRKWVASSDAPSDDDRPAASEKPDE